jgi:uncharacterized membrane protein
MTVLGICLTLGFCFLTSFLARSKGYNGFLWFLPGAVVIGLLVVIILPATNVGNLLPEEMIQKQKIGNVVGASISALIVCVIIFFLLGSLLLWFYGDKILNTLQGR